MTRIALDPVANANTQHATEVGSTTLEEHGHVSTVERISPDD
jgi:hypothetical protein